jgi:hypothetical protein
MARKCADVEGADPGRGVYARRTDGSVISVHTYQGGDYRLEDIVEFFEMGIATTTEQGLPAVELSPKELRQLKALADAYSFDYEEGLIELCLEIYRFALNHPSERYRFWADF